MLKRLMTVAMAIASLTVAGCSSRGGCGGCSSKGGDSWLHCEKPCYGKSFKRDSRQMMDFVDVYFLNYDKHDPFRCDPCLGD